MTVPLSKRSLSDMEFYRKALLLRTKVTEFLLRDFALKPRVRTLENLKESRKMTDSDAKTLCDLMDKYNLGDRVIEEFPEWWIEQRRLRIDRILSDLLEAIRLGNAIYPNSLTEYEQRRAYQTKAIGLLDCLTEELQFVVFLLYKNLGLDIDRLTPFLHLIEEEYALLKGWRKGDNKIRSRILKEQK